ncbi:MAG: response regulator [Magnetococcales bacterium]|nr:response regulator [Magnetococcales bacterium]
MSVSPPAPRILYMEDDAALAELVRRRLVRRGYGVEIASDGVEGLAKLQESSYDVVVLDYNMPQMNGLEVLRRMIENPASPPAVIVSGVSTLQVAIDALRLGAADYVIKESGGDYLELLPGTIARILEKQTLILEKKRAEEALLESANQLRSINAQLQEAILQAERANSEKSRFLAAMSHEIRTPMNAILGMGEMLAEGPLNDEQQDYVQVINRSGQVLLALINDILDLSKIEAGQLKLEEVTFDLRLLLENMAEMLKHKAASQETQLSLHLDDTVATQRLGDPQRVQQILLNLLSNAVKFTVGGEVTLSVTQTATHLLRFSVADTGIGIPLDRQTTIFQPFIQAETSTSRRFGGTGLGLSICQKLVEKMAGTIWVVSQPGQGSTFHVELPLRIHVVPEPPCDGKSLLESSPTTPPAAESLAILLVDDSDENRFLVQAFLKKTPHRLTMATDGMQAVQLFQAGRFDLVLMDIQMPGMDGYQATRTIRTWERQQNRSPTPILALTANAMREDVEKTQAVGCDLHISKPITKKQLLDALLLFAPSHAAMHH